MIKRWLILAAIVVCTACAAEPTATPPDIIAPTNSISTTVPIPTLLPTVALTLATRLVETQTPAPTSKPNVASATRANANRFAAPTTIAPSAGALFKNGNDIPFTFEAVGRLEPTQCYLLHVELAVPQLPNGNRGDDFLDLENCGDSGPAGQKLEFVLYRGKFTNSPNYGTILAQTSALAPEAKKLNMTWTVRVVQNNGRAADGVHYNTVALSPGSPIVEFEFQP